MRKSTLVVCLATCLAGSLLAATAFAAKYGTKRAPDTDFSGKETFAFAERGDKRLPTPGSELDTRLRRVVTRELLKKGLRPIRDGEAPDFVLDYEGYLGIQGDMPQDDRSKTRWVYFSEAPGGEAPQVPKETGRLIIELRDPASDEVVWAGWASDTFRNQDKFMAQVDRIIARIARSYPD